MKLRSLAPFVALLSLTCLAGCSRSPLPRAAVLAAPSSRALPVSSVQTTAEYRRAEVLFQKKDYRGALSAIEAISHSLALTDPNRAFLARQRDICESALSGHNAKPAREIKAIAPVKLGDCGPRALAVAAKALGVSANAAALTEAAGTTRYGTSLEGLKKAAGSIGLEADGTQMDGSALKQLKTPALAWVDGEHFLAVLKVEGDRATVHDPNNQREEVIETNELLRRSGGILLTLWKGDSLDKSRLHR